MAQPRTAENPRLLMVDEACGQLGISRNKAYDLMRTGELAYIRIPGQTQEFYGRRIEQSEIDAFIARYRRQGDAAPADEIPA